MVLGAVTFVVPPERSCSRACVPVPPLMVFPASSSPEILSVPAATDGVLGPFSANVSI